jgi:hypothetical protein
MAFPDILLSAPAARNDWLIFYPITGERSRLLKGPESGLDRLDSVSVRVGDLVKDGAKRRRLRRSLILDKVANANNQHPSDQGRPPDQWKV